MESKVSKRLTEPVAPVVCDNIYSPRLAKDFGSVFGYITELNRAHLITLHRQGLISQSVAKSLAQGLARMEREGPSVVALDPQREDSYFNYEAHLIQLTGADLGGRLHIARSRNDLNCAVDRLRARDMVLKIGDALAAIEEHLLDRALAFRHVVMPGYTHMQPAQPITYGFYLAAVASSFSRDAMRLLDSWSRINLSPLGAGALAGTTFDLDRAFLASLMGFDGLIDNTLDAVASRDFGVEILGVFSQLATGWSRIAQDYFVWVTNEFQTIDFPDSVTGTSSIMPQKKNPIVLEHLKGKAGHFLGLYVNASTAIKGSNFTNTIDGNRESMRTVWEGGEEMMRCLPLLHLILSTATPNAPLLEQRVRADFATVTDLADLLYRQYDVPFRAGHHIIGAVVRQAMDRNLTAGAIDSAMIDAAACEQIGRRIGLSPETISEHIDPLHSLAARTEDGAPSPASVERSVERLRQRCQARSAQRQQWRDSISNARKLLGSELTKFE